MDLIELLRASEGKTLEFKRDLSGPLNVLKSLVAFTNTAGGVLILGVEDGSRNVVGLDNPLQLEEKLSNIISDGIAPRVVPDIELLPFRDTHVLAIQVYPSSTRPHHLVKEGALKGVYVRVGSSNRRADSALIEELRRLVRSESFDEQPIPELDSEALDFRAASEQFAPVRPLRKNDLHTLRLLTNYQGREVPTVGGILLFGREREQHFPDAWIQAGRFRGEKKTVIADSADIRSLPVRAVEEAIDFVEKHSLRGVDIGRLHRTEQWSVPPKALREAVVNAVAHCDYSQRGAPIRLMIFDDRVEVENPGLLPFGLTIEDLRDGISKLRNRVVGRVFHELRLIEQWGSGIQRMTQACLDAGLPAPLLEEKATRFRVTISTQVTGPSQLDPTDKSIIDALEEPDGLSTSAIASQIGMSTRATRTRLIRLVELGLVREIGTGPRDPKRRYYRAR